MKLDKDKIITNALGQVTLMVSFESKDIYGILSWRKYLFTILLWCAAKVMRININFEHHTCQQSS